MAIKTFTTGEVLTASDTNTYLANSGLVYITEVALSTTAIDGIFTSTYDNYRIVIQGAITSGSNGLIQLRWRDTSNATVGSSNYQSGTLRFDSTGTSYNYATTGAALGETGVNLSTSTYGNCVIDIYSPRLTQQTSITLQGAAIITGVSNVLTSGTFTLTTAMAGIIFNLTAGTFAGGRVYVYGYREA